MESNEIHDETHNEIRNQLREAERAAAAPYITMPPQPWWTVALLSSAGSLFAMSISPAFRDAGTLTLLPSLCMLAIAMFVIFDQRKRRGVTPRGKAPLELRAVYRWYFIGAAVVVLGIAALGYNTSPWFSLPMSFVACWAGLTWFGTAYERACKKVRARLA